MITIYFENLYGLQSMPIENNIVYALFGVYIAFVLAFYLLRSIGVYTLAKKAEIKKAGLAFVPCLWFYPFCMLVKEGKFFGKNIGKFAVLLTVFFTLAELVTLAYNFLYFFPVVGYYLSGGDIYINYADKGLISVGSNFNNPYTNQQLEENIEKVLYYSSDILRIISIVIEVSIVFSVFRKYSPQHYLLFSLLSIILGLLPIFIFAIRKKDAVDYKEFLRKRYGAYYGNPYGPYGNPNDPNNPYNRNNHNSDPFNNEFNSNNSNGERKSENKQDDDPFEEFSNKNK